MLRCVCGVGGKGREQVPTPRRQSAPRGGAGRLEADRCIGLSLAFLFLPCWVAGRVEMQPVCACSDNE